jgi:hypothetical protein
MAEGDRNDWDWATAVGVLAPATASSPALGPRRHPRHGRRPARRADTDRLLGFALLP